MAYCNKGVENSFFANVLKLKFYFENRSDSLVLNWLSFQNNLHSQSIAPILLKHTPSGRVHRRVNLGKSLPLLASVCKDLFKIACGFLTESTGCTLTLGLVSFSLCEFDKKCSLLRDF